MSTDTILLVLAAGLFIAAGLGFQGGNLQFGWFGLACVAIALL